MKKYYNRGIINKTILHMNKTYYLIHQHHSCTSAIDNYYLFDKQEDARKHLIKCVRCGKNDINDAFLEDICDSRDMEFTIENKNQIINEILDDPPEFIQFNDGDYVVFTKIENGRGRRP